MADNDIREGQIIAQEQIDLFSTPLEVVNKKLDADQYTAEDLDGVTESLFGSGNLNFLSLQGAQSDLIPL